MTLVLLLYALCASSFTISKAVLLYSAPIFFVAFRMIGAGMLLLGCMKYKGSRLHIAPEDRKFFASIVFFHIYVAYVLDLWSLQYLTSFKSSFLFNSSPFITALISYYLLDERMNRAKWIGLVIGCCGLLPMLLKETPTERMAGQLWFLSIPEIMVLVSVFASCIGWISVARLLRSGYNSMHINGFGMLVGGLFTLVTSMVAEHWIVTPPVSQWQPFIALTLLIIVVCNIAFYNLYGYLLQTYSTTFLSFAGFVVPLFTALFGVVWLDEQVTWHFFVAMMIVGVGLYIFYREELKQKELIVLNK